MFVRVTCLYANMYVCDLVTVYWCQCELDVCFLIWTALIPSLCYF
jgi:hypothetical protein